MKEKLVKAKTSTFTTTFAIVFTMIALTLPAIAFSQMEKRESEEFLARQFASSLPIVGEPAPDLLLKTIDGQLVTLADYRGKNIVIVKAGYT